jgi:hypothetical protein
MKLLSLLSFTFTMGCLTAEDVIYYPEYEDSVCFYASFHTATPDADISVGQEKPVQVIGKLNYADGIRGKALCCGSGGANSRYDRKDNITFDRPGTLLFFFRGLDWHTKKGSRIFFTGIESNKGFFGLQIPGWPKNICPCSRDLHIAFQQNKKIKNKTLFAKIPGGETQCGKWHMMAFSWAPGQLRINMDNLPGKTYQIDFELKDSFFPYALFSIGFQVHGKFLLDEYTIYNRRLSDGELLEIYNKYMK